MDMKNKRNINLGNKVGKASIYCHERRDGLF